MSLWSDEQRRLLAAMGYTLYARAEIAAAAVIATPTTETNSLSATPAHAALRRALQRAASDRAYENLVDDLDALRRDPARKRALWPQLRALRRPQP